MNYIKSSYSQLNDPIINDLILAIDQLELTTKNNVEAMHKIAHSRAQQIYAEQKLVRDNAVWTYNVLLLESIKPGCEGCYIQIEKKTDAPIERKVFLSRPFRIINHVLVFCEPSPVSTYYCVKWEQRILDEVEEKMIYDFKVPTSFEF